MAWYREHGRPVDIVIPSYRDAERVATLVGEHPRDRAARDGAHHRRRRRERPRARRRAAADRGDRGRRGRARTRASPPTSTAACARPTRTRDVVRAQLRHRGAPGWLACLQYAASQERGRRHRRRPAAVPRRAHPVRRHGPQPRAPRSGSTTATASSPRTGARPALAGPGAGRDGRLHVRHGAS